MCVATIPEYYGTSWSSSECPLMSSEQKIRKEIKLVVGKKSNNKIKSTLLCVSF